MEILMAANYPAGLVSLKLVTTSSIHLLLSILPTEIEGMNFFKLG